MTAEHLPFREFLTPNQRPYLLAADEDANLVGMRLYGEGPFHREFKLAINIQKKTHFVIRSGDVIYNKLFAWKGTFGIVPPELDGMFVSDKFPTYSLDVEKVDPGYLRWYFRTPGVWEQAKALSTGSAAISKLTLNPPLFLSLTAPVPPLCEQRRIVAKIEQLASKIAEARKLRQIVGESAEPLLLSALDRIVVRAGSDFGVQPLGTLVEAERGISYGVVLTGAEFEGGVPTLRAGDIQRFRVLLGKVKRVDPTIEAKYARTRLRGRELLLRIRGGLGEIAVCPAEMHDGNVSREIAVIPLLPHVVPEFAMYAIAAPTSQDFLIRHLRGTSYIGINLQDVRRLAIPLPPLPEQRRIVAYLDDLQAKVDQLKTLQAQTAAELDALLPSILDRAFRGEL
ncbi:MAG: hypothetical protein GX575_09560 [Candidatus Anammoximicrobium sp.]|nr:hypothetical protein [Candidatus Anammoximicrobium sp.]